MLRLSWMAAVLLVLAARPVRSQPSEPANIRSTQAVLGEKIEAAGLQQDMPLSKFLTALEKLLPANKKVTIRLDDKAFGDKLAEIAATPVRMPPFPKKMSVAVALRLAMSKAETEMTYRIGAGTIVLTSRTMLFTDTYDIADLVAKPHLWRGAWPFPGGDRSEATEPARIIVQFIVNAVEPAIWKQSAEPRGSIEIVNGTRLIVRANAVAQAEVEALLLSLRRLADLSVILQARLYEVDEDFHKKLTSLKRRSLDEEEKLFLDGKKTDADEVFALLAKQTRVQAGDEVKTDNGLAATLLSKQQAVICLPRPDHLRTAKEPQTILEGIVFRGEVTVSADRRVVRVRLTEKATDIVEIRKVKVLVDNDGKEEDAEIAFVKESGQTQALECADGGSVLALVQHRPKALRDRNRWYVLSITTRIFMEEEERNVRLGSLVGIVPQVVADILKNPRLKSVRDVYGTPDDKRAVFVDSDAWNWPDKIAVAGYELVQAKKDGNRLLGIRIDGYDDTSGIVSVSLVNAGGNANGAVAGAGMLRYRVRQAGETWVVELVP